MFERSLTWIEISSVNFIAVQKDSSAISNLAAEILFTIFEHLDLSDVFVARFVSRLFHKIAHSNLIDRKRDSDLSLSDFKNVLNEANFYYEKSCPRNLTQLWCSRCIQFKDKNDFAGEQRNQRSRNRYEGRFCRRCARDSDIVLQNDEPIFKCSRCTNLEEVGVLWEAGHARMCEACWVANAGTLSQKKRAEYWMMCTEQHHHQSSFNHGMLSETTLLLAACHEDR